MSPGVEGGAVGRLCSSIGGPALSSHGTDVLRTRAPSSIARGWQTLSGSDLLCLWICLLRKYRAWACCWWACPEMTFLCPVFKSSTSRQMRSAANVQVRLCPTEHRQLSVCHFVQVHSEQPEGAERGVLPQATVSTFKWPIKSTVSLALLESLPFPGLHFKPNPHGKWAYSKLHTIHLKSLTGVHSFNLWSLFL